MAALEELFLWRLSNHLELGGELALLLESRLRLGDLLLELGHTFGVGDHVA